VYTFDAALGMQRSGCTARRAVPIRTIQNAIRRWASTMARNGRASNRGPDNDG